MVQQWAGAERHQGGLLDDAAFRNVETRLAEQVRSAREWRDQVNTNFVRKSGVPDRQGRQIYR